MSISRCLRSCLPMGLNVSTPFNPIAPINAPPSLLPSPQTILEEELRRNAFWLGACALLGANYHTEVPTAYALERTMGAGHGWALMLDDQDITQLLPMRGEDFDAMVCFSAYISSPVDRGLYQRPVPPQGRQLAQDADVLIRHSPDQTDPFILYIKACMLLSRVKMFHVRFRTKYYTGDPSTFIVGADGRRSPASDIRKTPAFVETVQLVYDFQSSIPPQYKRPMQDGVVNAHLFMACTAPHL